MLEHTTQGEMVEVMIVNLAESADTCGLIVDQCIALAEGIFDHRSTALRTPGEQVIRAFATATVRGLRSSGEQIAHTGPPAATRDADYAYLARVIVGGEPATQVFPPGEYVMLPIWATAAMLSLLPEGVSCWRDHLRMI